MELLVYFLIAIVALFGSYKVFEKQFSVEHVKNNIERKKF